MDNIAHILVLAMQTSPLLAWFGPTSKETVRYAVRYLSGPVLTNPKWYAIFGSFSSSLVHIKTVDDFFSPENLL